MWAAQLDLFGPCTTYVPGFEKQTRGRKSLATEVHVMVFVCPVSRLVNLQVIEGRDAGAILQGVTRMSCEMGIPKYLLIDDDKAIRKALRDLEVDIRDLKYMLHKEKGIVVDLCPVSGHNSHGHVERVIRSIQESLADCGVQKLRLTATGLQTFLKLVENTYNNAPLGFSYGRDVDNCSILKTISPNMLRLGRSNDRALDGHFRLAGDRYQLLEKVQNLYQAWFQLWKDAVVPRLIRQPKWFVSDKHLKPGDLVYFEKDPQKLSSQWIMGKVDMVHRGTDGIIRNVDVMYRNSQEDFNRITNRAVRTLVKLFALDENCIQDDLAVLQRRIDRLSGTTSPPDIEDQNFDAASVLNQKVSGEVKSGKLFYVRNTNFLEAVSLNDENKITLPRPAVNVCDRCCCYEHCRIWSHSRSQWKKALEYSNPFQAGAIEDCDGEKDYFAANVDEYTAADGDMMNVLLQTNVNFDSIWSSRSLMV